MNRRQYLGVLASSVSLAGCSGATSSRTPTPEPASFSDVVTLQDMTWNPEGPVDGVFGQITNTGDRTIESLYLRAEFYDSEDVQFDSTDLNIENLEPGETAELEIEYYGYEANRVDSYEITINDDLSQFAD